MNNNEEYYGLYKATVNNNINPEELAIKIYNQCSDMDIKDYADTKEEELSHLASEIKDLINNDYVYILKALEMLSE